MGEGVLRFLTCYTIQDQQLKRPQLQKVNKEKNAILFCHVIIQIYIIIFSMVLFWTYKMVKFGGLDLSF